MEEILKEVLIKKCGNRLHDQVLIIENLPSRFIWEQTRKMEQQLDRDGYPTGNLIPAKSGELVWTTKIGIEKSQTRDGGYCFWTNERDSNDRLLDIMKYVEAMFPRDQRIPEFVDNAQMRGEMNSGPLSYFDIPRVVLPLPEQTIKPAPVPVLSPVPQVPQEPSGNLVEKVGWTPERRAAAAERMKKMQEERKAKKAVMA